MAERSTANYLAWFLAHDLNFAPFDELKSELDDIGDDEYMVLLASKQNHTNALFICDQEWDGT